MAVTVGVESPLQDDVRRLIAALNAHLLTLTPPEQKQLTAPTLQEK